jgi:GTPase
VRQSAKIIMDKNKYLRVNDTEYVTFRFLYHPEFILKNTKIFFRDGKTKGIGNVIDIIPLK